MVPLLLNVVLLLNDFKFKFGNHRISPCMKCIVTIQLSFHRLETTLNTTTCKFIHFNFLNTIKMLFLESSQLGFCGGLGSTWDSRRSRPSLLKELEPAKPYLGLGLGLRPIFSSQDIFYTFGTHLYVLNDLQSIELSLSNTSGQYTQKFLKLSYVGSQVKQENLLSNK